MKVPPIKFLLVDDLDSNLVALQGLLEREGLELLKARSGPEALELLLVHEVALALLDVQMPGMNGFELAELMRGTERTRRVPIIFLTAGAVDQQRRFRGYDAGAVDFIFKPIEPHILRSKAEIFFELAVQRETLRRTAEEAQRANRAKDDFLAALSHELRTPLTPVLLTAASLQGDDALSPEVRAQLAMIRRNVELEAKLIDDLLDITRISSGKFTIAPVPTDIHEVLGHTLEIVRGEATGKALQFSTQLEAREHHALVDPTRIQQVFWNLVKNAVKFTPAGGSVSIVTRNEEGGSLVVSVADTGLGISAEALPRIFRAFEQGDVAGQHRYGGLGLGLAISHAIVEVHGGKIVAQSEGIGRGATFTVTLKAMAAPANETTGKTPSAPVRELRVLLVEDDPATNTILTRLLTRSGHQVTAVDGIGAARAAFEAGKFDVLITDLGLPDGSGLDFMRELRGRCTVPGIALSGYGMEKDLQESAEAGFFAHLTKPINIEQLRAVLQQMPG